jgi:hypothetical protein
VDEGWVLDRRAIAFSLARALRGAGREREAADAAGTALELAERKGDLASAARARAFLEA